MGRLLERERELAAVELLLERGGGVLVIEGRAGVGKSSLVEVACLRAGELGHEVVRARGSELEAGASRSAWHCSPRRPLAGADTGERAAALAGPAAAVRPLLLGELADAPAGDSSFALADFQTCGALFGADMWGMETHETGYVHARSGAALALLGDSVAVLEGSPALLERAHSLAELGAALRRSGERAAARDPLTLALELAVRCGARPLAARVRDEVKATGARPRRPWRTGVEALTPSELRVARLGAEGRSNREIACELYVSLKAIEGHLARAYAKLGIEGRGQLPHVLGSRKD